MLNKPELSPSPQLWLCRVGDSTKNIEQETQNLLSSSEKQRLTATKNINKRREFLLSRALMRHALSQQFHLPVTDWEFIDNPDSAPIISNLPEKIYCSLSHSNGLIGFITSIFPIGIDLELSSKKRDFLALAETFMSDQEINLIKNYNDDKQADYFYRIWCAKEAYYKADPTIQLNRTLKNISIFNLIDNHKDWHLIEQSMGHFKLFIIVKNKLTSVTTNHFSVDNDDYDRLFTLA